MNADGPPSFAPGWYRYDANLRWWDGTQWGPFAPSPGQIPGAPAFQQTEEAQGRSIAVLCHLGFALGGFILPLVLYLIEEGKPNRNRFVCHHASEALNFLITFMLGWVLAFGVFFVSMFASLPEAGEPPPWGAFLTFPLIFGLAGASWVFGIMGAWKASKGQWWRYPVSIRFVARGIDWQNA